MLTRTKQEIRKAAKKLAPVPAEVTPPRGPRVGLGAWTPFNTFERGASGVSMEVAEAGGDKLDLAPLREILEPKTARQIAKWVRKGERLARRARDPVPPALKLAAPGESVTVPCAVVRPGQAQISFDRARTQIDKFLRKLDGHAPDQVRALAQAFGLLEIPAIIGPGGASAYLVDRNHNYTGLMALKGWLSELNTGRTKLSPELASLCEVFLGERTGFEITVEVDTNHSDLTAPEFAAAMQDRLFLERRDGTRVRMPPARFADLEDNPYRQLASETRVKVTRNGPKRRDFELSTRDRMVWVKGPQTPDYIEFPIATVFAQTLAQSGVHYDGRSTLKTSETALLRRALDKAVTDPEHPLWDRLQRLVVVPKGVDDKGELHERLKVTRKKSKVRLRKSRLPKK